MSGAPPNSPPSALSERCNVVLLDRDGVINKDLPTGVLRVEDFEPFEQALRALAGLHQAGVTVAVITNQACVGRGELTVRELDRIHARMLAEVEAAGGHIDAIFACIHRAEEGCSCRKPKPGLLAQARDKYLFKPQSVWLVGDDRRDVEAAEALGCKPALVRTGKGEKASTGRPDVPCFVDLEDFVQTYLRRGV